MIETLIDKAEKGAIPDWLIRQGMNALLKVRLNKESVSSPEVDAFKINEFVSQLQSSPIALEVDAANEQHYEVPAEFFNKVLGPRLKYSSCYFPSRNSSLLEAEEASLTQVCQRAEIKDGMRLLDLGCGWGSLSLWMAEKYPNSEIVSVSNSSGQKEFIDQKAKEIGRNNITVITKNIAEFDAPGKFDRVLSIEAFEHLRNYQQVLSNISSWLNDDGLCFIHIFCHAKNPYLFEVNDASDWMSKYFFTGGMMPSDRLLYHFQDSLILDKQWRLSGVHYQRTLEAWLDKLDNQKGEVLELFKEAYGGEKEARIWLQRWRIFFMACSQLFGYRGGREWWVSHYLFKKRP